MNKDDMSDEEFLRYCWYHSESDRALFSAWHCRRLFFLAGEEFPEPNLNEEAWRSMKDDLVKPLVDKARERLKR